MIKLLAKKDGFSAVELLVTLFVAAIFLFSGYQVYLAIVKDGGEVRQQAAAGSVAYKYLKEYKITGMPTGECTQEVLKEEEEISESGITNATITIERLCPVSDSPGIYQILVTVYYDEDRHVNHSTYYLHPTYRMSLDCPTGFIEVPGDERFGTSDFCVMKYEAKNVGGVPVSQAAGVPWTSIPQYGAINVASGKTTTGSIPGSTVNRVTDGVTTSTSYYAGNSNTHDYVTVDLGPTPVPIYQIGVWHYWNDGRAYSGTKTEVSANGTDWFTVFDSAEQGTYPETSAGRHHVFEVRNVRYIRDYLFGSTANTGNHWVEIAAYSPASYGAYEVAKNACPGCKLITEAEWMTIAHNVISVPSNWSGGAVGSGFIYSGHNDNNPSNILAASNNDADGYSGTGNSSPSDQRRTLTLTNGEVIWDFAGNVFEWTQGLISGKQPGLDGEGGFVWKSYTDSNIQWNNLPSVSRPVGTLYTRSQGVGGLYSNSSLVDPYAMIRGGSYLTGSSGVGVLTLGLHVTSSSSVDTVGFRVTK